MVSWGMAIFHQPIYFSPAGRGHSPAEKWGGGGFFRRFPTWNRALKNGNPILSLVDNVSAECYNSVTLSQLLASMMGDEELNNGRKTYHEQGHLLLFSAL